MPLGVRNNIIGYLRMLQRHIRKQLFELFRYALALDAEDLFNLLLCNFPSGFGAEPDAASHNDNFSAHIIIGRNYIIIYNLFNYHNSPAFLFNKFSAYLFYCFQFFQIAIRFS